MGFQACPPGHYCLEGAVKATPCPAGTYTPYPGASDRMTSAEQCEQCIAGYYCKEGSSLLDMLSQPCAAGTLLNRRRCHMPPTTPAVPLPSRKIACCSKQGSRYPKNCPFFRTARDPINVDWHLTLRACDPRWFRPSVSCRDSIRQRAEMPSWLLQLCYWGHGRAGVPSL